MAGAAGCCRQRRSLWNKTAFVGYRAQLVQDGTLENIEEGAREAIGTRRARDEKGRRRN